MLPREKPGASDKTVMLLFLQLFRGELKDSTDKRNTSYSIGNDISPLRHMSLYWSNMLRTPSFIYKTVQDDIKSNFTLKPIVFLCTDALCALIAYCISYGLYFELPV